MKVYEWGFSLWQVVIMLCLILLWSLGIWIMWLKAHLTIRLRGGVDIPGRYKAALQFVTAVRSEFADEGVGVADSFRDQELKNTLRNNGNGGYISFQPSFSKATYSFRQGIRGWWKRDKWWGMALITCAVAWVAILVISQSPVSPVFLPAFSNTYTHVWYEYPVNSAGQIVYLVFLAMLPYSFVTLLLSMAIGKTNRSRLFYTSIGMLVGLLPCLLYTKLLYTKLLVYNQV